MTVVATFSGASVSLIDPKPETIRLDDIAAHLAAIPRWLGAARLGAGAGGELPRIVGGHAVNLEARAGCATISVAQHCLLVNALLRTAYPRNSALALWGLLHDAHEAYCGDITTPTKAALRWLGAGAAVDDMQRKLDYAIAAHFGLPAEAIDDSRHRLHWADHIALRLEADAAMLEPLDKDWRLPDVAPPLGFDAGPWLEPMPADVASQRYARAVRLELSRYHGLHGDWRRLDEIRAAP